MSFKNFKIWVLSLAFFGLFSIFSSATAKRYYNENANPGDTLMNLILNPGAEDTLGGYWDVYAHIPNIKVNYHDTTIAHKGEASFLLDTSEKPSIIDPDVFVEAKLGQRIGVHQPNTRRIDELTSLEFYIRPERSLIDSLTRGEGYFDFEIILGEPSVGIYHLIYYTKPALDTGFIEDTKTMKYIKLPNLKNREWNVYKRNIMVDWKQKGLSPNCLIYGIFLIEKGILKRERVPGDTAIREKWCGDKINVDDISLIGLKYQDPAVKWIEVPDTAYESFQPKASITNLGKKTTNCTVHCAIFNEDNNLVYHNSQTIEDLRKLEEREISFKKFEPIQNGLYNLYIYFEGGDEDTTNNSMNIPFYYKHKGGIEEIIKRDLSFEVKNSKLEYYLPERTRINLEIYDIGGRFVNKINRTENSGKYEIDLIKQNFPSGVYFIKFKTENYEDIKKIILIH